MPITYQNIEEGVLISTESSVEGFAWSDSVNFSLAVGYVYPIDLDADGIDEVLYAGFETLPNTPETYDSTKLAVYGWRKDKFQNLTDTWLPDDADLVEGVGEAAFGDYNGDGNVDVYLSAFTDMNHYVNAYVLYNDGTKLIKQTIGLSVGEHGVASADINLDGFDDVLPVFNGGEATYILLGSENGLTRYIVPSMSSSNMFSDEGNEGSGIVLADFLGDGSIQALVGDSGKTDLNSGSDLRLMEFIDAATPSGVELSDISMLPQQRLDSDELRAITGLPESYNSHDVRPRALDFTGDGLLDAVVFSNGSWDGVESSQIQFYENMGGGIFVDVTNQYLIDYPVFSNTAYTPVFKDFNGDGDLDIYVSAPRWSEGPENTALILSNEGVFEDKFRQELSSWQGKNSASSTALQGPDGQFYLVKSEQDYGGSVQISISAFSYQKNQTIIRGDDTNNVIELTEGNNSVDGGNGIDTASYSSTLSSITNTSNGYSVNGDTLINVERIQFTDTNVALDIDGRAGQTAKILGAVFGKDAVSNKQYAGIGLHFLDSGVSYETLMDLALNAALGDDANNHASVVKLLYKNVLNVDASDSDAEPFIQLLEDGMTKGALGVMAAETTFNAENIGLVGLQETGLAYELFEG